MMKKMWITLALLAASGIAAAALTEEQQIAKDLKKEQCSAKQEARKFSLSKLKEVEEIKKEINQANRTQPVSGLIQKRKQLWDEINKLPGSKRGPLRAERDGVIKQIDEIIGPMEAKLAEKRAEHQQAKVIWQNKILPCTEAQQKFDKLVNDTNG